MIPDIRYYFEIIKFTAQGDETIYANTRKLVAGGVAHPSAPDLRGGWLASALEAKPRLPMADESQLKILNQGVSALGTADFPLQSPIFGQGGLR